MWIGIVYISSYYICSLLLALILRFSYSLDYDIGKILIVTESFLRHFIETNSLFMFVSSVIGMSFIWSVEYVISSKESKKENLCQNEFFFKPNEKFCLLIQMLVTTLSAISLTIYISIHWYYYL